MYYLVPGHLGTTFSDVWVMALATRTRPLTNAALLVWCHLGTGTCKPHHPKWDQDDDNSFIWQWQYIIKQGSALFCHWTGSQPIINLCVTPLFIWTPKQLTLTNMVNTKVIFCWVGCMSRAFYWSQRYWLINELCISIPLYLQYSREVSNLSFSSCIK